MESTKVVPDNVAYCRGTKCDKLTTCAMEGSCQYKSSAELLREEREARAKVLVESIDRELEQMEMFPLPHSVVFEPVVEHKPSNPKDIIGSSKLPLHLFPLTAIAQGCLAFLEGVLKYGRSNFRKVGVRSSIYYDALRRHMDSWFEGEDIDPESGLPHLAKALACIAVLIDAEAAGKLEDDRMMRGGYAETVKRWTPLVAQLKDRHADKHPKHYTIKDEV